MRAGGRAAGAGRGATTRAWSASACRGWRRPACCSAATASRWCPRSPGTTRAARRRRRGSTRRSRRFRGDHRAVSSRALRTVAKYRWLRDHVPEAARGVRWLSVGEWVVHRLGGEQAAELSLASRTGWLDLHSRGWWDETRRVVGRAARAAARARLRRHAARPRRRRAAAGARRRAGGRRPRPPERGGGRRRGRRGRRARLVGHRRGARARGRAARPRARSSRRSTTTSWSAGTPSRSARTCSARCAPARRSAACMALLGVEPGGPRRARARGAGGRARGDRADRAERLPRRARQHRRRPLPRHRLARGARVGGQGRTRPARQDGARGRPAHAAGDGGRVVRGRRRARDQGGAHAARSSAPRRSSWAPAAPRSQQGARRDFAERQVGPHDGVAVAGDAPVQRQRVHQVEPEPAMERIRLAPLRLARAARVLDLDVEDAVALRRADAGRRRSPPARRAGCCWPPARWPRARRRPARCSGTRPASQPRRTARTSSADSARAKTFMCSGLTTVPPPGRRRRRGAVRSVPVTRWVTRNVARETARVMDRTRASRPSWPRRRGPS